MNEGFIRGFLKEAQAHGCSQGEAWDILKAATSGAFPTPSFSPPAAPNPNPPIVDSVKPSTLFPISGNNPGSQGGMGSLGTSSLAPAPKQNNFGFNINQTGLGGINNSVTSAPPAPVNNVLNKAVMPSAAPSM